MRVLPVLAGALGLAALQLGVSSSAGRVSGLLGGVAKGVRWWLSPAVPAIPDHRLASSSTTPAAAAPKPSANYPAPTSNPLTKLRGVS